MHREESPQHQISRDLNNSPLDLRPDQDLAGEEEEGGVEPHGEPLDRAGPHGVRPAGGAVSHCGIRSPLIIKTTPGQRRDGQ